MIVGLDGSVRAVVPNLPYDAVAGPRLSPEGDMIAFVTGGRVAVIQSDGTGMRMLTAPTNNTDGDATQSLSWSPDGSQIAYAANDDIWIMNADGSDQHRLTDDPAGDFQPAWSADDVIAYWHGPASGDDGGPVSSEIYTIPVAGGTPTRVTSDHASSIAPAWSPDGRQIAYFHGSDSGNELWIVDADGSGNHRVHVGSGGGWAPSWSPDGSRIAYLTCCASYRANDDRPVLNVSVVDLASGDVTDVGVTVETDFNGPSWVGDDALLINRYD
jgi:Tol biopolymer transport system component